MLKLNNNYYRYVITKKFQNFIKSYIFHTRAKFLYKFFIYNAGAKMANLHGAITPEGRYMSLYKPEYCQGFMDAAAQGLSKVKYAASIGVSYDTLHRWEDKHPEFAEAVEVARTLFESFWEKEYCEDMRHNKANGAMWTNFMRNRCKWDNMGETRVKTEDNSAVTAEAINAKISLLMGGKKPVVSNNPRED